MFFKKHGFYKEKSIKKEIFLKRFIFNKALNSLGLIDKLNRKIKSKYMKNRIIKKISILTSAILISLTSVSFGGSGDRYMFLQGGKTMDKIKFTYSTGESVDQPLNSGIAIGYGKKRGLSDRFGLESNIGYEVDFSSGYKGSSGEGPIRPCLSYWGQGACSIEIKNILNMKLIFSGNDAFKVAGFQPYAIAGLSSATIKSLVDSGSMGGDDAAGADITLTDERRLGYIVGIGIDKDMNKIAFGLNYTVTDYGDALKGTGGGYASAPYRHKLLNLMIKKPF